MEEKDEKSISKQKKSRKSGRKFPYYNLEECIELTKNVEEKGGGRITQETLAKIIGSDPQKTAFKTRVSAAKHFNLITTQKEFLVPTELAKKIIYPISQDISSLLQEAFFSCELYVEVFRQFRGKILPDRDILNNIFIMQYGVSRAKRTINTAVKNFIESGIQSGIIADEDGKFRCVGNEEINKIAETTEPLDIDEILGAEEIDEDTLEYIRKQGHLVNLNVNINLDTSITNDELIKKLKILKEFIFELQSESD